MRRPGKVFARHWAGLSPVRESEWEGILVRTAFLARRASTSKSRLKKGSRAVLRPDRAPSLYNSPHEPCSPRPGSAGRGKGRRLDAPTIL